MLLSFPASIASYAMRGKGTQVCETDLVLTPGSLSSRRLRSGVRHSKWSRYAVASEGPFRPPAADRSSPPRDGVHHRAAGDDKLGYP